MPQLIIRWTIGNVSEHGFAALRLSIYGAMKLFGTQASYVVCVNTIPLGQARALTGEVPDSVIWRDVTNEFPEWLRPYFDPQMAEGVGWKFAPLRLDQNALELSLDNDCIIWCMPDAVKQWVKRADGFVFAEDVVPCFGQFDSLCGTQPRNSGIRGLPPRFDLAEAFLRILHKHPVLLKSELDEQGLQTATLTRFNPAIVTVDEVTICSPFPPHIPSLGSCGAHFVGLNAKHLPWEMEGRPAVEITRERWNAHLPKLYERVFSQLRET
jgi:hypothetical protein